MRDRTVGAIFLLLLFTVGSQLTLIYGLPWEAAQHRDDEVTQSDRRLGALRGQLPQRGTIGYKYNRKSNDPNDKVRLFYQAQYALAPLILDPSAQNVPVVIDGETTASISHSEAP